MDHVQNLTEWAQERFGDSPSPEVLELCSLASQAVYNAVLDPRLWFEKPRLDLVRLIIQSILVDLAAAVVNVDRKSEPDFFGTVTQEITYVPRPVKTEPPLRHLVRSRNGNGRPHEGDGR